MSENMVYKEIDEIAESYILSLTWSGSATEHEKTLVAGNIRGFVEDLKKRLDSCDACTIKQLNECYSKTGCLRND